MKPRPLRIRSPRTIDFLKPAEPIVNLAGNLPESPVEALSLASLLSQNDLSSSILLQPVFTIRRPFAVPSANLVHTVAESVPNTADSPKPQVPALKWSITGIYVFVLPNHFMPLPHHICCALCWHFVYLHFLTNYLLHWQLRLAEIERDSLVPNHPTSSPNASQSSTAAPLGLL